MEGGERTINLKEESGTIGKKAKRMHFHAQPGCKVRQAKPTHHSWRESRVETPQEHRAFGVEREVELMNPLDNPSRVIL
jgi:hypothetical protein